MGRQGEEEGEGEGDKVPSHRGIQVAEKGLPIVHRSTDVGTRQRNPVLNATIFITE